MSQPTTTLPGSLRSVRPLITCDRCQRKSEPTTMLVLGLRRLCWLCQQGKK